MLTIFESKKEKAKKGHIRNLIALAKADGVLTENEEQYILKAALKNGLKEEELNELYQDAKILEAKPTFNDSDRFDQIFDCVQLMMADGQIDDEEMDFCIELAEKLGFRKAIVGVLVRKISLGLSTGLDKEAIKADAANFLVY